MDEGVRGESEWVCERKRAVEGVSKWMRERERRERA